MRVEVRIEQLVLEGADLGGRTLSAHQARVFREALAGELTSLLREPGSWTSRQASTVVVSLSRQHGPTGATAYGRAVARSVHTALTGAARLGGRRP